LDNRVEEVLRKYFGYRDFKAGQEKIIDSILKGHDTMGIMPTGGGKSLCYQIPALILPGITIVISPLIALMKDQVDAMNSQGVAATYINSSLRQSEIRDRLNRTAQGEYKILYIAPERLTSDYMKKLVEIIPVSVIAIDEAHCVSQWGHDFRPSYRAIASWIETMPYRPVLAAFTATATRQVRDDIVKLLGLHQPRIKLVGFDRANLYFSVIKGTDKSKFIDQYLKAHPEQSGIVYAATRKEVDSLYEYLQSRGYKSGRYHAGMSADERTLSQDAFIYDEIPLMVATNAFGLGIDKSNIRFVIHHNMPRHLEAYYQEAGRAGRDGEAGDCILLYSAGDVQIQKFLIEQTLLSEERKEAEYVKLQQMVDYCHTTRCLRQTILQYFGEENTAEFCNNCANCNEDFEKKDMTIEAQKILSCVIRMNQQYGTSLVAAVLKGSQAKRIKDLRLDQLSTYGIMADMTIAAITDIINILLAEDYLNSSNGQYPVLRLGKKARPVLRKEAQVILNLPSRPQEGAADDSLFESLRALRKEIAQKEQVPPYIIFHDSTLREMSLRLPADYDSMLAINGIGESKMQNYGQQFLDLIISLKPDGRNDKAQPEVKTEAKSHKDKTPSHMISWALYQQGNSLAEIAGQREIKLRTVEDHILRCAREGCSVNWDEFIDEEEEKCILEVAERLGFQKLTPIKQELAEDISYFTIKAVLYKHNINKNI